ncbi:MAG: hypothetical protein ACE5HC_16870 [Candidatus Binatia bacterium]
MNEAALEGLTQRLDRMERENRRWKLLGVSAIAAFATVVLMGQSPTAMVAKVLEAEKFVVRDTNGNNVAELGSIHGSSFLHLTDKDKSGSVSLSALPDGPRRLQLWDKSGPRVQLIATQDGEARLRLFDMKGIPRASLDVQADGLPILRLADKNSKTRAELLLTPDDTPLLSFYDRDKGRKFIGGMGVAEDGSMTLALVDKEEQSLAELRVPPGAAPHLRFIDKDGKVLWSTPELGQEPKTEQ